MIHLLSPLPVIYQYIYCYFIQIFYDSSIGSAFPTFLSAFYDMYFFKIRFTPDKYVTPNIFKWFSR